jgi:hypothetical protein
MTTLSAKPAIAPTTPIFDPVGWLEQFEQVGGGYHVTDTGIYIGWIGQTDENAENRAAKAMVCALTPAQHGAIELHLLARKSAEPTAPILAAWDRIKRARAIYNASSPDDEAAERAHWAIVDPAEAEISRQPATTVREAEIKLWCALAHCTNYATDDADVHGEQIEALIEREATFDFAARILIGAIRDLRNIAGEA